MDREVVVAITNGLLDFGPWEQILGTAVSASLGVRWAAQEAGVGQDDWGIEEYSVQWASG